MVLGRFNQQITIPSGAAAPAGSKPKLSNRVASNRILHLRRDLRQRLEHESSLAKTRVRDFDIGGVDDPVCVQDQIKIQRPRCTRRDTRPAPFFFQRQQESEQRLRLQLGPANSTGIQVRRLLIRHVDRICFEDGRRPEVIELFPKPAERPLEMPAPIAEIGSDRNRYDRPGTLPYSIHRTGRTPSPVPLEPGPLARRPSRSSRPASIWSKKRFCSSVSPRMTLHHAAMARVGHVRRGAAASASTNASACRASCSTSGMKLSFLPGAGNRPARARRRACRRARQWPPRATTGARPRGR